MAKDVQILTEAQFRRELARCEYCEEKPCLNGNVQEEGGCPAGVSPTDFIMAARGGKPSDIARAAAIILSANPLGGVCGMVCPDWHCMRSCVHENLDCPINIPALQATIIQKARELGVMPEFSAPEPNGAKVAVVGAGPAGLAAAAMLGRRGFSVDVFEKSAAPGGAALTIPDYRLPPDVLDADIEFCLSLGTIDLKLEEEVESPESLLAQGYDAVVVTVGRWAPITLGIPNENLALPAVDFLLDPDGAKLSGRVAVIGGGAVAADCAVCARRAGADYVEMFALESVGEMPLTEKEFAELRRNGVDVNGRVRVTGIRESDGRVTGLEVTKISVPSDCSFSLNAVCDLTGCDQVRDGIDAVILAIGNKSDFPRPENPSIFYAGDVVLGPTTVVEAVASGKEAALRLIAARTGENRPDSSGGLCRDLLPGYDSRPAPLQTDFFGFELINPFLLSAAPPSDGFEQMKKAYEAGWAGGIMKTAFDGLPIHIPGEYMYQLGENTFANCDNVSGHCLDRVCREIGELKKLFPDRLTGASTGGTVSGDDEQDRASWQANTRKLEEAGAMVIEYSLSCPQGGEGAEGDIVSQNAKLTAKIIDWVLAVSDPAVPKLFKLTPAVTEITTIVKAIAEVFARHPEKKAGITLGNTFPCLDFRPMEKSEWEEGAVVGMSGSAVAPINYLTLAKVGNLGVHVSGNGGPMDYMAAANFLALGTQTVQFCTIAEKYGVGIINELCSGLSHLLAARGIGSVKELIGIALPEPIRDFMDLSATKKISSVDEDLCVNCGNCTRCPYLAISLDERRIPQTDPERCIGCGMCTFLCPAEALSLRERTQEEVAALKED